jgi:hypothetical protein
MLFKTSIKWVQKSLVASWQKNLNEVPLRLMKTTTEKMMKLKLQWAFHLFGAFFLFVSPWHRCTLPWFVRDPHLAQLWSHEVTRL